MKASKKQTGTKIKLSKGKRVSLRCPLSVDHTDLEYNFDTSAVQICMTLENMGGGGLSSDTVESAVIVVRLFDKDGQIVPCDENDYFAKSLRFGEEGLAGGAHITFRLIPDCTGGARVEDAEIYISRIRYSDGVVTDYVRGDFFDLPGDGVLLTKKFKKNADAAIALLGEGATYLPEHLTEIVWRCTCGEFSESDACPSCGRNKAELFAALDTLTAPKPAKAAVILPVSTDAEASAIDSTSSDTPAGNEDTPDGGATDGGATDGGATAEYAIGPQIAAAKADMDAMSDESSATDTPPVIAPPKKVDRQKAERMKLILMVSISAASVILLIVILLLILTLCGRKDPGDATTTDDKISEPSPKDTAEKIVRSYLAQHDYDNALGYATLSELGDELLAEIYAGAINYYTQEGQYEKALDWAKKQNDTVMINSIYALLFSQKLSEGDYIGAMEIADLLPAEQQENAKNQAAEGYVTSLVSQGKYKEAMEAADQYKTSTTSAQIAETAITGYIQANKFDDAIALANSLNLSDKTVEAAKAAVKYYTDQRDYDRAVSYLPTANDSALTSSLFQKLTDLQIRRHMPLFFGLLSFQEMQAIHASPISAKPKAIAVIDRTGNVYLGDQLIYNAEETGTPAVSVSASDTAVIALLSDGTVQMVEGSSSFFTADDLADWKDVVAVSAGNYHLLGLTKSGRVLSAGSNLNGQCDTDAIRNAVAVSAGDNHSLILLSNGTVTALGSNTGGVCNTEEWRDIVAISAGSLHSIGLRADGTAVSLGNCDVSGWTDVVAIFSRSTSAVGLTSTGSLHYSASGSASGGLFGIQDAIWVSVGKMSVTILHADGTVSVPVGSSPDPSVLEGIELNTKVFGIR